MQRLQRRTWTFQARSFDAQSISERPSDRSVVEQHLCILCWTRHFLWSWTREAAPWGLLDTRQSYLSLKFPSWSWLHWGYSSLKETQKENKYKRDRSNKKNIFEGEIWGEKISIMVLCCIVGDLFGMLQTYSFLLWFFFLVFFDRVINYTRVCLWYVSLLNDFLFVRFILLGRKLVLLES